MVVVSDRRKKENRSEMNGINSRKNAAIVTREA
jgi:hypothetical protein